MLTIRTAQKEILATASFERRLVEHAQRFFPKESATLGKEGTLAFIRQMVQKARGLGLSRGPDISSYIDLAFTFGRDFESAPWATELVTEAADSWNEFTIDALFEAAIAELDPEESLEADDEEAEDQAEYENQHEERGLEAPPIERDGGPDL